MKYLDLIHYFKNYPIFSLTDIKKIDNGFHRRRLNEWQDKGYIKNNGSPSPIFETDDARTFFLVTLPIHSAFNNINNDTRTIQQRYKNDTSSETHIKILSLCKESKKTSEIMNKLDFSNRKHFKENYLDPLINEGFLKMEYPDKPTSPKPKYTITPHKKNFGI
jgi:ATP-dependent DNA helicase RecG